MGIPQQNLGTVKMSTDTFGKMIGIDDLQEKLREGLSSPFRPFTDFDKEMEIKLGEKV